MRIDSSKKDSSILISISINDTKLKDFRIDYLDYIGIERLGIVKKSAKNIDKINTIPVDSILRISPYSNSIPYDVLLVPYTDFYHMEIAFDFPFYRESNPIVFNCCDKGKDYSKSKEVVCPDKKKRQKRKVRNEPNCKECKLAYKVFN